MRLGIDAVRHEHPNTELELVEPSRDNTKMFMYSPMNFAARRVILEEAYTSTMKRLKDPSSPLHKLGRGGATALRSKAP